MKRCLFAAPGIKIRVGLQGIRQWNKETLPHSAPPADSLHETPLGTAKMTSAGKRYFLSLTTGISLLLIHCKKEETHFKLSFPTAAVDSCRASHIPLDSLVTPGGERAYTLAREQGCTEIRPRVLQHTLSPAL